jgi:membrane protein DedA with SNARE-associated domain
MAGTSTGFISFLTPDINQYVMTYGLAALFIIIAIEEAGVPLPLPGDLLIVFFGYQARQGEANPFWIFFCVIVATTLGASVLYGIGHRGGRPLVKRYGHYIRLDRKRLRRIEGEFHRHGIWTIVLGRLIPGFRVYISVIAGVCGFPPRLFVASIVLASTLWVLIYFAIGYLFGEGFLRIEGYLRDAPHMVWVIVGVVIVGVAAIVYFNVRRGRSADDEEGDEMEGEDMLSSCPTPQAQEEPRN